MHSISDRRIVRESIIRESKMPPSEFISVGEKRDGSSAARASKLVMVLIAIAAVLSVASLGVGIATLVKVNSASNDQTVSSSSSTSTTMSLPTTVGPTVTVTTPTPTTTAIPSMVNSIQINETMTHLKELQRIADISNGTRAVSTSGFNLTLNYITEYLANHTDYNVTKSFFNIRQFELASDPILISSVNGVTTNYTYSTNLSKAEFYFIQFSTGANFLEFQPITAIPDVGCTDADWQNAVPPPAGNVVLVKRGNCSFADKGVFAAEYNATAILIYNDGTAPDRVAPLAIGLGQENQIPALFLSFTVGEALAIAAQDPVKNTSVQMIINPVDLPLSPVGNICADTPSGDPTQTIVIGSHSDSVPAGPGINDNGTPLV